MKQKARSVETMASEVTADHRSVKQLHNEIKTSVTKSIRHMEVNESRVSYRAQEIITKLQTHELSSGVATASIENLHQNLQETCTSASTALVSMKGQFDKWKMFAATTRLDFSTLSSSAAGLTQQTVASETLTTRASVLLTTATTAISQFDTDSVTMLSDFTATSAAKLHEYDWQLQSDRENLEAALQLHVGPLLSTLVDEKVSERLQHFQTTIDTSVSAAVDNKFSSALTQFDLKQDNRFTSFEERITASFASEVSKLLPHSRPNGPGAEENVLGNVVLDAEENILG